MFVHILYSLLEKPVDLQSAMQLATAFSFAVRLVNEMLEQSFSLSERITGTTEY